MHLHYLGGSGFRLDGLSRPLLVDPPLGTTLPEGAVVLLSHGHADHVDAVRRWLWEGRRPLIGASAVLLRHLGQGGLVLEPGRSVRCCGAGLRVFRWRHRPRLHRRPLAGLAHLCHLGPRPRTLWRTVADGVRMPVAPELGFVLTPRRGAPVALLGEALHPGADVAALAREVGPVDQALVGVEAADLPVLPELLRPLQARRISLFEPHRHLRAREGQPVLEVPPPHLGPRVEWLVSGREAA